MNKYDPLKRWLADRPGDRVTLTFADVERIIGTKLPDSSSLYPPHWRGSTPGRPGGAVAAAGWSVVRLDHHVGFVELARTGARRRVDLAYAIPRPATASSGTDWRAFEDLARRYFSVLWGVDLRERVVMVAGERKRFDLVSPDLRIVGDAKAFSEATGASGKRQAVAEYVLLLQTIDADRRFLVFSGRSVATDFLRRFRAVAHGVEFYLLESDMHTRL